MIEVLTKSTPIPVVCLSMLAASVESQPAHSAEVDFNLALESFASPKQSAKPAEFYFADESERFKPALASEIAQTSQPEAPSALTRQWKSLGHLNSLEQGLFSASILITAFGYARTAASWRSKKTEPNLTLGLTWTVANAAVVLGALYDPSPGGALRPLTVMLGSGTLLATALFMRDRPKLGVCEWTCLGLSLTSVAGFLASKFGLMSGAGGLFSAGAAVLWGTLAGTIGAIPKLTELYAPRQPQIVAAEAQISDKKSSGIFLSMIPTFIVGAGVLTNALAIWSGSSASLRFSMAASLVVVAAIAIGEGYKKWKQGV